jgi:EmrB/QacA subfamily drug resistance transporter
VSEGVEKFRIDRNLVSLSAASFMVPFMGSAINLALPNIGNHFNMNAVTLTWVATSYLITTAILQIPFAKMADMLGRKKMFFVGILVFSIGTFCCGIAFDTISFMISRVLSGLGSAMMFGTSTAILVSLYPPQWRGRILAINVASVYVALAIGPLFGGFLTDYFGWQSIFIVSAIIGFVVLGLCLTGIKGEWTEAKGDLFDYVGSGIYAIALFCIIYGFSDLEDISGIVFLLVGILATILFILYERRQIYPIINIQLFSRNKVFSLSTLAALINYAATSATAFMLSLYLQYIQGLTPSKSGLVLICGAAVQSAFSLMAGRWSDKINPAKLATIGMAVIAASLLGFAIVLDANTPIWFIIAMQCLLGMGFGIFSSPNTNTIMSSVDIKYYGQASATTGTARLVGQTFSLGIAGMAIAMFVGDNVIVPTLYPQLLTSLQVTYIIFSVLCFIGIYCSAKRSN